jgi:hypothetical protein
LAISLRLGERGTVIARYLLLDTANYCGDGAKHYPGLHGVIVIDQSYLIGIAEQAQELSDAVGEGPYYF